MSSPCILRQLDERHMQTEAGMMLWSPKMDLVAVAHLQGDVSVHRLSWQRVWLFPPPEDETVTALSWRTDGKILSIGYTNGAIVLLNIENSEVLESHFVSGSVTSLMWTEEHTPSPTYKPNIHDKSSNFLPPLPSKNRNEGNTKEDSNEDVKQLSCLTGLTCLVVGTDVGGVFIYALGVWCVSHINMCDVLGCEVRVLRAVMSDDLTIMFTFLNVSGTLKIMRLDTSVIEKHATQIHMLALKFGEVSGLLEYISQTINSISETWENILVELDCKMMSYARSVPDSSVSADFLELLMFGNPPDELKLFLLQELTDKGLKKLGHSIDLSYTTIQNYVMKHLQRAGQAVMYHLAEMQGMARWTARFGMLHINQQMLQKSMEITGGFVYKSMELQQVINVSVKNFKSFFKWLFTIILKLSEEPVPTEVTKVSQQDLSFIAEFLNDQLSRYDQVEDKASLDKVGQYLNDEDLTFPVSVSTVWSDFLKQHPALEKSSIIYPNYKHKSLLQVYNQLKQELCECFTSSSVKTSEYITSHVVDVDLSSVSAEDFRFTSISSDDKLLFAFTVTPPPSRNVMLLECSVSSSAVLHGYIGPLGEEGVGHKVVDINFYNTSTLSMLLAEDNDTKCSVLVQLNMPDVAQLYLGGGGECDIAPVMTSWCYRRLESVLAVSFCVSGSRKVAAILMTSRRRVRLYEMDVEEEDEEETACDSTNRSTDTSLQLRT